MFNVKKPLLSIFIILTFIISITGVLFLLQSSHAQYWAALPPYNVMWPLWSPVLSPPDPITGLPTPLVPQLTRMTVLPLQPGLAWDPCQPAGTGWPWLLYNTPIAFGGGLLYWDLYYGMNPWPPSYMLDPVTGAPAPITLPLGWSVYLPTKLGHNPGFVDLGNLIYSYQYGVPLLELLTAADIWGFPPLASLPTPII